MKLVRRILIIITIILMGGLLLGYFYQFTSPGRWYLLILCALTYSYLATALFICFIFLALLRSFWAIPSLLILLFTSGSIQRQIGLNFQRLVPEDSLSYKMMTFNTKDDFRYRDKDQKEAFVSDYLEDVPDILVMQEVSKTTVRNLKAKMEYPHDQYQETPNPANGLAIFSKFPLKRGKALRNEKGNLIAFTCDVTLPSPSGTIRLINMHLHTNAVTLRVSRFSPESISRREGLRSLQKMIRSYRNTAHKRMKELMIIRGEADASPYPVIIAGDVNDIPLSPVYRKLKAEMTDTFVKGGLGFAQTYNESFLALKIDHIFVDPDFKVIKSKIKRIRYSDHNPVSTIFTLAD